LPLWADESEEVNVENRRYISGCFRADCDVIHARFLSFLKTGAAKFLKVRGQFPRETGIPQIHPRSSRRDLLSIQVTPDPTG
jgi:hypothetical protein